MPLTLSSWKSTASGRNLPANKYEVIINSPVGGQDFLNLRTENIILPGVGTMAVDNYSPYGNGLMYNIPYRYNPQEITMVHVIDDQGALYQVFREWMNTVVDLDGPGKFGAKYLLDDYAVDGSIKVYNDFVDKPVMEIKLKELFPLNIDSVSMGWGQNDETAKLSVSYRFTRFEIS
jgi:hypothetical protein